MFRKNERAVPQVAKAFEKAVRDDRLERIQLELAGFGRKAHSDVVADDLESDLVNDFRDHGIHFPRHDRRAGLNGGQPDLVETRLRPR